MTTYTFTLPEPDYGDVWTLSACEVKEEVPEGDWIDFQQGADMDPCERVLAFSQKVLAAEEMPEPTRIFERTHEDGWTIRGEIHNDWYSWVVDFVATHPVHGTITREGDDVTAPSKEVWDAFIEEHPLTPFDYGDI